MREVDVCPKEALIRHNLVCLIARRRGEDLPRYEGPRLAGQVLTHLYIPWVNLSGVDLHRTEFMWSDLEYADLSYTDVTRADFGWCNLRHADCERMTYHKTNFFCTDLRFAVIEPPNDIENFFFNGARMPQRG